MHDHVARETAEVVCPERQVRQVAGDQARDGCGLRGIQRPQDPGAEEWNTPEPEHAIDAGLTLDPLARRRKPLRGFAPSDVESRLESLLVGIARTQ